MARPEYVPFQDSYFWTAFCESGVNLSFTLLLPLINRPLRFLCGDPCQGGFAMFHKSMLAVTAFASLATAHAAQAQSTFNFESDSLTFGGGLTSYTATDAGLTLTLTRSGSAFDVSQVSVAAFGQRTLDPFSNTGATSFLASFSSALSAFSIDFGDFGADSDAFMMTLFSGADGTGSVVGTVNVPYGTASLPGAVSTASFSGSSFQSVSFIAGSTAFPNSVYYDNLRATVAGAVPEPGTWAMMLLGFGAMGLTLRRRSRIAALAA